MLLQNTVLMRPLLFLSLFGSFLFFCTATDGLRKPISVKATWIPVSSFQNASQTTARLTNLKWRGVDRVYVDSWNNGKTYFNSSTMYDFVGVEGIAPNTQEFSFTVKTAHRLGMEVFAWFEYGLMSAYENASGNAFALKVPPQFDWRYPPYCEDQRFNNAYLLVVCRRKVWAGNRAFTITIIGSTLLMEM
jgi:uncharacterized lipoprotein YddW (UPF0748 family)